MGLILKFSDFLKLDENTNSYLDSIIIGDSLTPLIDKHIKKAQPISRTQGTSSLWKGGMGLKWLKDAVDSYQVSPNIKNVVISIGTNGGFNERDDVKGLSGSLKKKFPNSNLIAIKGSWGWGGNRSITADKVEKYYRKFSKEGINVIPTAVGFSATDREAHSDRPVLSIIGKEVDSMITSFGKPSEYPIQNVEIPKPNSLVGVENIPDDVEKFQDWLDINKPGWAWGYLGGVVNRSKGYGRFGPRTSKAWSQYSSEYQKSKTSINVEYSPDPKIEARKIVNGLNPDLSDKEISKKYNFHIIPDGKESNYRSAQFTEPIMKNIYKKYGIKNVIRLNGDGLDSKHHKSDPGVSISREESICRELGCNFYRFSSTNPDHQEKIKDMLLTGNTLVHCAHGADRTGGAVGGYLYKTKINPLISTTKQIWNYTTKYNGWNNMVVKNPKTFQDGYLRQAQKFGVSGMDQAISLASLR
jgi:hypothetical protein